MGRELRRKQAKKDGRSLERVEINDENQMRKYLINIFVLVGVFSIIYLLTGLFITKEIKWFSKDDGTEESTSSVSNAILASSIFNQSEESYYVYFYDFDEKEVDSSITSLVSSKLTDDKVYKVNIKDAMNAKYVGDTGNKKAKSLDDLKVTDHTLIKVSGDKITEYYEKDEITKKLS